MRRYVYAPLDLLPPPLAHACIIQKNYYNARTDGVAIAPPQARNPKNFYLGNPFTLRQSPREPSIPIIMASLVFLARLAI